MTILIGNQGRNKILTHTDLCRITAEKFCKAVAIYEVKDHEENPDVITFYTGGTSVVFEIKMSRADFLADKKKKCRNEDFTRCGNFHAYVCNGDFIKKDEIPEDWGLYYYINGKFKEIKSYYRGGGWLNDNKNWKTENSILIKQIIGNRFFNKKNIVYNKRYKQ